MNDKTLTNKYMLSKNTSKLIYSLLDKKNRDKKKLFIAEGPKILKELILSQYAQYIIKIFATKEFVDDPCSNDIIPINFKHLVEIVSYNELKHASLIKSPNSAIALCSKPNDICLSNIDHATFKDWFVILEDVQDPNNVGAILRTADWFGIKAAIFSNHTADSLNPKTIQSSMGSVFNLKIIRSDIYKFIQIFQPYLYATALHGDSIYKSEFTTPGGIILGNESRGIKANTLQLANKTITIPGSGKIQSLNINVAFGIICSNISRKTF